MSEVRLTVLLEEYRSLREDRLLRLELQQKNLDQSLVLTGALVTVMATLLNNMTITGFVSRPVVLIVPFTNVCLVLALFRSFSFDHAIHGITTYIDEKLRPRIEYSLRAAVSQQDPSAAVGSTSSLAGTDSDTDEGSPHATSDVLDWEEFERTWRKKRHGTRLLTGTRAVGGAGAIEFVLALIFIAIAWLILVIAPSTTAGEQVWRVLYFIGAILGTILTIASAYSQYRWMTKMRRRENELEKSAERERKE